MNSYLPALTLWKVTQARPTTILPHPTTSQQPRLHCTQPPEQPRHHGHLYHASTRLHSFRAFHTGYWLRWVRPLPSNPFIPTPPLPFIDRDFGDFRCRGTSMNTASFLRPLSIFCRRGSCSRSSRRIAFQCFCQSSLYRRPGSHFASQRFRRLTLCPKSPPPTFFAAFRQAHVLPKTAC